MKIQTLTEKIQDNADLELHDKIIKETIGFWTILSNAGISKIKTIENVEIDIPWFFDFAKKEIFKKMRDANRQRAINKFVETYNKISSQQ